MKFPEDDERRARWLGHALCRRYAVVSFNRLTEPMPRAQPVRTHTIWWAFGCLVNGDSEILGTWNLGQPSEMSDQVIGDLRARGLERVRCVVGGLGAADSAISAAFNGPDLCPSIEQSIAARLEGVKQVHRPAMACLLREAAGGPDCEPVAYSAPGISSEDLRQKYRSILAQWVEDVARFLGLFALPQPYRHLGCSVDRAAAELQARLTRAMVRNGPFIDRADAFDFVANWLGRADLRLEQERRMVLLATEAQGLETRRGSPATTAGTWGAPALV